MKSNLIDTLERMVKIADELSQSEYGKGEIFQGGNSLKLIGDIRKELDMAESVISSTIKRMDIETVIDTMKHVNEFTHYSSIMESVKHVLKKIAVDSSKGLKNCTIFFSGVHPGKGLATYTISAFGNALKDAPSFVVTVSKNECIFFNFSGKVKTKIKIPTEDLKLNSELPVTLKKLASFLDQNYYEYLDFKFSKWVNRGLEFSVIPFNTANESNAFIEKMNELGLEFGAIRTVDLYDETQPQFDGKILVARNSDLGVYVK